MKEWRSRLALGFASACLAACGGSAGKPADAVLGHGAHVCISVTQALAACFLVTRREAPERRPEATAPETQAGRGAQGLNRLDPSA